MIVSFRNKTAFSTDLLFCHSSKKLKEEKQRINKIQLQCFTNLFKEILI